MAAIVENVVIPTSPAEHIKNLELSMILKGELRPAIAQLIALKLLLVPLSEVSFKYILACKAKEGLTLPPMSSFDPSPSETSIRKARENMQKAGSDFWQIISQMLTHIKQVPSILQQTPFIRSDSVFTEEDVRYTDSIIDSIIEQLELELGRRELKNLQQERRWKKEELVESDLHSYGYSRDLEEARDLIKSLGSNPSLTTADLSKSGIDDVVAKELAQSLGQNTTLRFLNLTDNRIGPAGMLALGESLQRNNTLRGLNLDVNRGGDEGAQNLALALVENTSLTSLRLGHNDIGDLGARALSKLLCQKSALTDLSIEDNPQIISPTLLFPYCLGPRIKITPGSMGSLFNPNVHSNTKGTVFRFSTCGNTPETLRSPYIRC